MSINASILAIGPYAPNLSDHLEYEASNYANIRSGVTVLSAFKVANSRFTAEDAADALGIGLYDFGTHADLRLTDQALRALEDCFVRVENRRAVKALRTLREAGFTFHFRLDS